MTTMRSAGQPSSRALAASAFLGGRLQTCRRLIDDGSIGDVTAASAFVVSHGHEWFHPNPDFFYQPGAGPLHDIGPNYVAALVSLLGPARRCAAMSKRTFDKRIIESEPNKGKIIDVKIDTHVSGSIEFVNGALATLTSWLSELAGCDNSRRDNRANNFVNNHRRRVITCRAAWPPLL